MGYEPITPYILLCCDVHVHFYKYYAYMYVQWETNFQHKISALCQKMTTVLSQQPARNSGVDSVDGNTASLEMQRYMHNHVHAHVLYMLYMYMIIIVIVVAQIRLVPRPF